jgi:hypothetical protein
MKVVVLIIGIVLVVAYLGNYSLITRIFPLWESDYDQFVQGYKLRNKIYEVMFCLLFYIAMVSNKGFTRAVFAFVFVMCAASCFDKIILHVSHYLWTDTLVVAVALLAAYYGYKRQSNAGQDTR